MKRWCKDVECKMDLKYDKTTTTTTTSTSTSSTSSLALTSSTASIGTSTPAEASTTTVVIFSTSNPADTGRLSTSSSATQGADVSTTGGTEESAAKSTTKGESSSSTIQGIETSTTDGTEEATTKSTVQGGASSTTSGEYLLSTTGASDPSTVVPKSSPVTAAAESSTHSTNAPNTINFTVDDSSVTSESTVDGQVEDEPLEESGDPASDNDVSPIEKVPNVDTSDAADSLTEGEVLPTDQGEEPLDDGLENEGDKTEGVPEATTNLFDEADSSNIEEGVSVTDHQDETIAQEDSEETPIKSKIDQESADNAKDLVKDVGQDAEPEDQEQPRDEEPQPKDTLVTQQEKPAANVEDAVKDSGRDAYPKVQEQPRDEEPQPKDTSAKQEKPADNVVKDKEPKSAEPEEDNEPKQKDNRDE